MTFMKWIKSIFYITTVMILYTGGSIRFVCAIEEDSLVSETEPQEDQEEYPDVKKVQPITRWKLETFPSMNSPQCNNPIENNDDNNSSNNHGGHGICDPDFILSKEEMDQITESITSLSELTVTCMDTKKQFVFSSSTETNSDTNQESQKHAPIEIALVMMNKMHISSNMDEETTAKDFAIGLHNDWGIGSTISSSSSCNHNDNDTADTGILFLFSIYDRTVFVSRGSALKTTLTDARIDQIIEYMTPMLQAQLYGEAIDYGLQYLKQILQKGPPSFSERFEFWLTSMMEYIIVGMFCLIITLTRWWEKIQKNEYVRVQSQLSKIDRDQALSLQGQYQCTSCPICLEDFQGVTSNDNMEQKNVDPNKNDNSTSEMVKEDNTDKEEEEEEEDTADVDTTVPLISKPTSSSTSSSQVTTNKTTTTRFVPTHGSDGLPLKLLRCGHVFDETCWKEYVTTGHGDIRVCPICKQDIGAPTNTSTSITTTDNPESTPGGQDLRLRTTTEGQDGNNDNNNTNNQQLYQRERNFRLARLQMRYPRYIHRSQLQRWTRQGYRDSLARDREFVQRNPTEIRNQRMRAASSSSSSSVGRVRYGGGRSSGGSGGRW